MCGLYRFYCWRHNRSWVTEVACEQADNRRRELIRSGWRIYHEILL